MNWTKKLAKIFSLIFVAVHLASCDSGCVEADEFDSDATHVDSLPLKDGVEGQYNSTDGGQRATWHDTGLRSNGDGFVILVSGAWVPWYGSEMTSLSVNALPACHFCTKKIDPTTNTGSPNCICHKNENPEVEVNAAGVKLQAKDLTHPDGVDCTNPTDQNNPVKCTCTKQLGEATDYGNYHFPLDVYNKQEVLKISDEQNYCKYNGGMGLFIGLFGKNSNTMPLRAYHLFTEESVCDITRDANGKCLDSAGRDATKYVFTSQYPENPKIFIKDDHDNNDGSDTNFSNDQYHVSNEEVKLVIYDRYYSDNYGQYDVTFLRGVNKAKDNGLLEYLVGMIEGTVMGEVDRNDGTRHGGIIEFLYKAIVQDSGFIRIVQVCLSLYIVFFSIATLMGLADINKKELMSRLMKIALIMFFTSPQSWYFYNKIIIGFFKDGMDYLIGMFLSLSDSNIDANSLIKVAQMDRALDASNATRFSYIDLIIKKLFSDAVSKKIWGLFFGSPFFGLLYIPAIYALIGFFLYTMLLAAMFYIVNVIKIAFALSLGPIFMIFTLFSQTAEMFKKWLSFIASRSLEVVIMFIVLYNFIVLIDKNFTSMLTYRACVDVWSLGIMSIKILKSYPDKSFIQWVTSLVGLGGLVFITKMILDKIPDLTGHLITIGGVANKNASGEGYGASGFKLAGGMLSEGLSLARNAAQKSLDHAQTAGALGIEAATAAARASGVADAWNKLGEKIPFRGIRTRARDSIIDAAIKKARADGVTKGFGSKPKEMDVHIRKSVHAELQRQMTRGLTNSKDPNAFNPNKMAYLGVNTASINKRLNQVLARDALKSFLKSEAKKLQDVKATSSGVPFGKEMTAALEANARKWANNSLTGGAASIEGYLKDLKGFMKEQSTYSSSQAAERFADSPEMQHKYLQHLQKESSKQQQKNKAAAESGKLSSFANKVGRLFNTARRDTAHNPKMTQENFMKRLAALNKDEKLAERLKAEIAGGLHTDFRGEKLRIAEAYDKKIAAGKNHVYKQKMEKKKLEKMKEVDARAQAFRDALKSQYQNESLGQNGQAIQRDRERNAAISALKEEAQLQDRKAKDAKDAATAAAGDAAKEKRHLDEAKEHLGRAEQAKENILKLEKEKAEDPFVIRARAEFEAAQKAYNERIEELSKLQGKELQDAIKSYGGIEAIKEGLIVIDGTSLFEKKSKLELIDGEAAKLLVSQFTPEKEKDKADQGATAPDKDLDPYKVKETLSDPVSGATAIMSLKGSVLPELNASAADALLKASDVGLKASNIGLQAGNPLLGGPAATEVKKEIEEIVKRSQASNQVKLRTAEMELKVLEYEQGTLDKKVRTPEEDARLNSLKKAIESAKQEVEGCRKEEEAFKQLVK